MRVFKNSRFHKFARKEKISDAMLCEAVERAERGQIDAAIPEPALLVANHGFGGLVDLNVLAMIAASAALTTLCFKRLGCESMALLNAGITGSDTREIKSQI